MYPALLMTHIATAVVGILSGFLAMVFRKGSGLHRAAGTVFFVSMLMMAGAGAILAATFKPNVGNVVGGTLTFYLVGTGWLAGRKRSIGALDYAAVLFVAAIAVADITFGLQAAASPTHHKAGYPPYLFFTFAAIALLFAASDVRMLVRRSVTGVQRLGRHVWRMCFALLIATLSFYPSRAHLFSKAVNASGALYIPHIVLIIVTAYWLIRIRARKRVQRNEELLQAAA